MNIHPRSVTRMEVQRLRRLMNRYYIVMTDDLSTQEERTHNKELFHTATQLCATLGITVTQSPTLIILESVEAERNNLLFVAEDAERVLDALNGICCDLASGYYPNRATALSRKCTRFITQLEEMGYPVVVETLPRMYAYTYRFVHEWINDASLHN